MRTIPARIQEGKWILSKTYMHLVPAIEALDILLKRTFSPEMGYRQVEIVFPFLCISYFVFIPRTVAVLLRSCCSAFPILRLSLICYMPPVFICCEVTGTMINIHVKSRAPLNDFCKVYRLGGGNVPGPTRGDDASEY